MAVEERILTLTYTEALNPAVIEQKCRDLIDDGESLEGYLYDSYHVPNDSLLSSYDSTDQRIKILSLGIPRDVATLYVFDVIKKIVDFVPGLSSLFDAIVVIPGIGITMQDFIEGAGALKARIKQFALSNPDWKEDFELVGVKIPDLGDIEQEVHLAFDRTRNKIIETAGDFYVSTCVSTSVSYGIPSDQTLINYFMETTVEPTQDANYIAYVLGQFAAIVNQVTGFTYPSEDEIKEFVLETFPIPSYEDIVPELPDFKELQEQAIAGSEQAKELIEKQKEAFENFVSNFIFPTEIGFSPFVIQFSGDPENQPYELENAITNISTKFILDFVSIIGDTMDVILSVLVAPLGLEPKDIQSGVPIILYVQTVESRQEIISEPPQGLEVA